MAKGRNGGSVATKLEQGEPSGAPRTTESGWVLLEPVHTRTFGDHSVIQRPKWNPDAKDEHGKKVGALYDEADSVETLKNTISYTIPGVGYAFDLSNKRHREILDNIKHDPAQKGFYEEGGSSQRFRIIDLQKDAETYLQSANAKMTAYSAINNFNQTESGKLELMRIGRVFGLSGSLAVVQMNLMQAIEKPDQLLKIMKHLQSDDKVLIQLIHAALELGDRDKETGLYKNQSGMYYWYKYQLGTNIDQVVHWLKQTDNDDAYTQMKNDVLESEK